MASSSSTRSWWRRAVEAGGVLDALQPGVDGVGVHLEPPSGELDVQVRVGERRQRLDERAVGFRIGGDAALRSRRGAAERTYSPPACTSRLRTGSVENRTTRRSTLAKSSAADASRNAFGIDAVEGRSALTPMRTEGPSLQEKRIEALGEAGLRRGPARLPAQRRGDRNDPAIAHAGEEPDVGWRDEVGEGGEQPLRPFGVVELAGDRRARGDQAIGLALVEIARRLQDPRDPAVGFVVAAQQDIEQLGAPVAFGGLDQAGVGYVFGGHHGADDVGVFDREIGDRVDRLAGALRTRARRRVAEPARQHPVSAAIGVQRDFERKALLGAPARVRPDEGEIVRRLAREQARHLGDMVPRMRLEIGEDLRVAAVGEAWRPRRGRRRAAPFRPRRRSDAAPGRRRG